MTNVKKLTPDEIDQLAVKMMGVKKRARQLSMHYVGILIKPQEAQNVANLLLAEAKRRRDQVDVEGHLPTSTHSEPTTSDIQESRGLGSTGGLLPQSQEEPDQGE